MMNILISGGGIAGPCLAWWLGKVTNANVTIIERAPRPRTSGQAVDIRDAAVDVIKNMGLIDLVKSKTTSEEGISFVYPDGKTKVNFPASGNDSNQSLTSEYEILRGDFAQILFDETKDKVKYVFDEYVTDIRDRESGKVKVTFANRLPETDYDLVVGADGQTSKTRRLSFERGLQEQSSIRPLGQYCSFFTIPRKESDTKWAEWYSAPKGRLCLLRPDQYGETRAYLAVTDSNLSRFDRIRKLMAEGQDAQQHWLAEEFEGAGWQCARAVEGMKASRDFYMQEIAQVKMEKFVKGRVALLGDAGYGPSPISGMGTSAAIVGAYVLAGELSKLPDDIPKALENYQSTLRPFVDGVQKLPPGAPQIGNPQSEMGIKVLSYVLGVASSPLVRNIASRALSIFPRKRWDPPEYPILMQQ